VAGADRCFVTFRYAADADQALFAFRPWHVRLWELLSDHKLAAIGRGEWMRPSDDLPNLKARRAPEFADLIWKNLPLQGLVHDYVLPAIMWLLITTLLLPAAALVLKLTRWKLQISSGENPNTGPMLEHVRKILASSGLVDIHDTNVVGAIVISSCIALINVLFRQICERSVAHIERPCAVSNQQSRLMRFVSFAYMVNVTVILFVAHTPIASSFQVLNSLAGSRSDCKLLLEQDTMFIFERYISYIGCLGGLSGLFSRLLEELVAAMDDDRWYSPAGLIPQIIVLAGTEGVFTGLGIFSVWQDLFKTCIRRAMGRLKFAQESINESYSPPEWLLADRYASMLKLVAIVVVFGPAAPVLYFIGGSALLLTYATQKLALVKFYRRPPHFDEKIARQAHGVLHLLLYLRVWSSGMFYVKQALSANSVVRDLPESPFATGLIVALVYSFFPHRLYLPRHLRHEDLLPAEEKQYHEARETTGIDVYSFPRSEATESKAPAFSLSNDGKGSPQQWTRTRRMTERKAARKMAQDVSWAFRKSSRCGSVCGSVYSA